MMMDMDNVKSLIYSKLSLIPKEFVPMISLAMMIVAFLLAVVFFGVCVLYINSKQKPKIIPKPGAAAAPKILERIRHEDLPILSGRLGEILSLYGFLKAGPVTKIFFRVLEILRNSTYDVRWRYKLPCLMMAGPENSGKTTLLRSLNFEHLAAEIPGMDSMWNLFKKGIIFEFPRIGLEEDEGKFWSFVSELFVFIRPRRPLDGLMITLPADMLLSDVVNIEKHAQEIFDKIFAFQHDVNFRLPIYLLVTKTDLIPGFSEFTRLLNTDFRQQIFGWSCPYSLSNAFSSNWIGEIFRTLSGGIRRGVLCFSREKNISDDLKEAILFESQFRKIEPSLSKYLHTMFHSHNPEDGLILRGVYFVGRSGEVEASSPELLQPAVLSPKSFVNLEMGAALDGNRLCFVQDLFRDKIFREHNLAHPIKLNAIDMTKVEYRNKIILAAGSTIISFGWFFGNNNIKNKIHDYYQVASSLKTSLINIKYLEENLKGDEDQILMNKYTVKMLQNMPVVKWRDLASIFVPQSWFSSLRRELMETVVLVFDSAVVRAMYIDLNLNTKNMLQNVHDKFESNHDKKDLFDVNAFLSFKNLREFTMRLMNIKRASSEYNSMRKLEDRKSVIDLTTTIFKDKFDITEAMKSHVPNKNLTLPKFDMELFRPRIEAKLRMLFTAFLGDIFDKTVEKILQSISDDVEKIVKASRDSASTYAPYDLAKTYNKTMLIADILKNKKFDWVVLDHFAPTDEYVKMIGELKASETVSGGCIKELLQEAEVEFHRFRSRLLEYKTDLTDGLLSENIQTPSVGFDNFQKEIRVLLDQPFIQVVPDGNLTTTILEDKMLIWDIKRLKEISELIDKYHEFAIALPPTMRPQYFEMYKTIARKCFHPSLISLLGSAQIFDDMPLGHSRNLLEDAYKRQATNIRNASVLIPKVVKMLDEMQEEDNRKDLGFSSMLISHYTALLEKIDALFDLETPYSSGQAVFDSWHGDKKPKFLNMEDQNGLRQYLTAQFERIKFLAKDLATPVVDFLVLPNIVERVKNRPLVEKWKSIINSVLDYEAQKPGNSIAALETFLSDNLSKVSMESIDDKGEISAIAEIGGDYFLSKRSNVAKSLLSRAEVVQYDKAAACYNSINKFFNESLGHKFPFDKVEAEASLRDIEKFIELYEQSPAAAAYATLERNREAKVVSAKALEFLKSMNKVIPFLKTWIAHSKASDPKTAPIAFNFQLRPAPNLEALTSSVLNRTVAINGASVENDANAIFFNDNKVEVAFNWVGSSEEKPYEKGAAGNLSIKGTQASFSYGGKWALLRLLENHKINQETEAATGGILVQFDVPIVDSSKGNTTLTSKMVMKITPMAKEGDKFTPMEWPQLPKFCPNLYGHERSTDVEEEKSTAADDKPNFDAEVPAQQPEASEEEE
ncbi:MAG: hypothetical protein LBB63_00365 [Holosporaceae bacterium]|jgi:type VI secretion system protein ImpL|nr:hypothetical protein [Holosporaceae bacterium]